jgi:hypothetical protein
MKGLVTGFNYARPMIGGPRPLPGGAENAIFLGNLVISYDRVGEWAPRDPLFFITRAHRVGAGRHTEVSCPQDMAFRPGNSGKHCQAHPGKRSRASRND